MRRYVRNPTQEEDLSFCRSGTQMTILNENSGKKSSGRTRERFFQLSEDLSSLRWSWTDSNPNPNPNPNPNLAGGRRELVKARLLGLGEGVAHLVRLGLGLG